MENKNNDDKKLNKFIGKTKNILDKDGFYVILFICICIVATTAVWVSKNNVANYNNLKSEYEESLNNKEENPNDDLITVTDIDDSLGDSTTELDEDEESIDSEINSYKSTEDKEAKPSEEQKTNVITTSKETTSLNSREKMLNSMIVPLAGTLSMDYAMDKLVYSKTLEQWTTHKGVDIKAKEGSVVRAALGGVISEIKKTDELGIVITLDNGNGITTKYGCLSTDEMVELGQNIRKGDPISGVGKACGFEVAQGPHLHFEVLKDGENINPTLYLPKVN